MRNKHFINALIISFDYLLPSFEQLHDFERVRENSQQKGKFQERFDIAVVKFSEPILTLITFL